MKATFKRQFAAVAGSVAMSLAVTPMAGATALLVNGDFETGTFAGWTVDNEAGGSGNYYIDTPGSTTPFSLQTTSAAGGGAHGNYYAVSDQGGSGVHVIRQSFTTSAGGTVKLAFDMFVNDYDSGPIVNAAGLTVFSGANQHARVDILTAGAGAFDTGATVLANYFLGVDAGADPNAFTHYDFDITSVVGAGGTFQIRFAEVDNQLWLNQGVDNVDINQNQTPEPAGLALVGFALGALACSRRRTSV